MLAVIHTLSDDLNIGYHFVLFQIADSVDGFVVMSNASKVALGAYHGIPGNNISVIPHGVPVIEYVHPDVVKVEFGWSNRTILLTNGLIHEGKGIDLVIHSLRSVVEAFPSVLYVIVGEPHPACLVCKEYYLELQRLVSHLGLTQNVEFVTGFQTQGKLIRYLQGTDVFVMAYRDRTTTNSGTLSMALAAGKLVVATPFEHARAVLPSRGVLVEYEDILSLSSALKLVVGDTEMRLLYSRAAYSFASQLRWDCVALQYIKKLDELTLP